MFSSFFIFIDDDNYSIQEIDNKIKELEAKQKANQKLIAQIKKENSTKESSIKTDSEVATVDSNLEKTKEKTAEVKKEAEEVKKTLAELFNLPLDSSYNPDVDNAAWNALISYLRKFGIAEEEVDKITRQFDRDLESFQVSLKNGDFKIIGASSESTLFQTENIVNVSKNLKLLNSEMQNYKKSAQKAFKGDVSEIDSMVSSLEKIRKSYSELDNLRKVSPEIFSST